MDGQEMMKELRAQASEKYRENMIRIGIPAENSIGVATSVVRGLAKKAGKSQELAFELWNTKYHEARKLTDETVDGYLEMVTQHADDGREHVKKAVSTALREIGKKNFHYNEKALLLAHEWMEGESKALRWIGKDAAKELETMVKAEGRGRLISANTRMGKESGGSG